jgi:hypothetical protein
MDFKDAYKQLILERKIRRKVWDKSLYLKFNYDGLARCYREEAIPFSYDIDIITSNDWFILKSNGEDRLGNFPFYEVIDYLKQGEKAQLSNWPEDCFIESTKDGKEIFMRRICEYDFVPTFECFTSNDWSVIDETKNME